MRRISGFMLALIAICLISCGENAEKYNKRAFALADSLIFYTDVNFDFCSECNSMWRSVIFDHKYISPLFRNTEYCYDFNDGIAKYTKDMEQFTPMMKQRKKFVDSAYATIKEAPEESENILSNIKEMLNIYDQSYNMALNPEGSLTSYTNNVNDLYSKFKTLKGKIEIDKK